VSFARIIISLGLAVAAFSCRGYDTIPIQEAHWRRIEPELVGMSSAELWRCAGPPLREGTASSGASTMIYRYADLKNYCEVTLFLDGGKVRAFSSDHSAPEFLWLLDGSNYCGRIFEDCIH
jgi:hypothetical protein